MRCLHIARFSARHFYFHKFHRLSVYNGLFLFNNADFFCLVQSDHPVCRSNAAGVLYRATPYRANPSSAGGAVSFFPQTAAEITRIAINTLDFIFPSQCPERRANAGWVK
jgi:hypothetical protein